MERSEFARHAAAANALYERIYSAVEGAVGPLPPGTSPGEAVEFLAAKFLKLATKAEAMHLVLAAGSATVRGDDATMIKALDVAESEVRKFMTTAEGRAAVLTVLGVMERH